MKDTLRPEDKLICLCARLHPNQEESEGIKQILSFSLDWGYITNQLKEQGVAMLAFYNLFRLPSGAGTLIPSRIFYNLQQTYYSQAQRNILRYQRLKDLLIQLRKKGFKVIILKGVVLAQLVYQNLALRPMCDIDLLVKKEDLKKIKHFLLSCGYKQPPTGLSFFKSLENFAGEVYLFKEDYLFLDIHSSLYQYERLKSIIKIDKEDGPWPRAQEVTLDNIPITILSKEDMIFHLCSHLSISHFYDKLIRFCDLRETIFYYKGQLDWSYIIQKAKDYHLCHIVYQALYLTQYLLGDYLDADILNRIKPNQIKRKIVHLVMQNKFSSLNNLKNERKKYLFQLLIMDSFIDALKLILKIIFPSSDWLRYRYGIKNNRIYYLYRFLHPCLIFRTFLRGRMELIFHD